MRWRRSASDIFVEYIQLYHNLEVHEKCIFIYEDTELDKKTPRSVKKRVVPNSADKPFFVPNYNGSCFWYPLTSKLGQKVAYRRN